ncbi:hypothetical protein BGZ60DRAFT_470541 [Tricladium varicosporioides]|nr:hypothetical protein BGZ60DRAFT_470541 [Hymenoscyphus varicosporioides]
MGELKLVECEASDAPELLAGHTEAFTDPIWVEPFFDVLWPERGERIGIAHKRLLDQWFGDYSSKYIKIVDVETGEIIASSLWRFYTKQFTEEEMNEDIVVDWHEDPETNEWASHLVNFVHKKRLARTRGAPCAVLDILSTRPKHQTRGAGSMMMKWGTDIADSHGWESFIEGSAMAIKLYEANGFVRVPQDILVIPVPEKWKGRPTIKYYWYERAANKGICN